MPPPGESIISRAALFCMCGSVLLSVCPALAGNPRGGPGGMGKEAGERLPFSSVCGGCPFQPPRLPVHKKYGRSSTGSVQLPPLVAYFIQAYTGRGFRGNLLRKTRVYTKNMGLKVSPTLPVYHSAQSASRG